MNHDSENEEFLPAIGARNSKTAAIYEKLKRSYENLDNEWFFEIEIDSSRIAKSMVLMKIEGILRDRAAWHPYC